MWTWPRIISFIGLLCLFLSFSTANSATEQTPIRFGVLSIAPPARIHANWQPFAQYISTELQRPVEIVVPRGFGKMKKVVENGDVDFFYINSHVFYRLKQAGKAISVAQMQNIAGKVTSRSDIFVRADSGISTIEQLRGKSIAFVAPMGAGGYLAPRAYMYSRGVKTKTETQEIFTKNLSNSIHRVLLGEITAASMCGVNYNLMSKKIDTGELKRIAMSDDYPENIIGARSTLDLTTLDRFTQVVTSMKNNAAGQAVLTKMHSMKIQNFLPYDASIENLTKNLLIQGAF